MINQADSKAKDHRHGSDIISYKFPDIERRYSAVCLNLTASGILLRTKQAIEMGKALEVIIDRENALTVAMIAYVEVIRSNEIARDEFEVRAEIKGIKEN